MEDERARTGVEGFDKMLHGGFMRGDVVLVAGAPGTGKSTIGMEFLINGATKFGEPGIFVTFEELPQQIYRDAANLGWDLKGLEEQGVVRVLCTSPRVLQATQEREAILGKMVQEMGAKRIVVDSISQFSALRAAEGLSEVHGFASLRKDVYGLINYLKIRGLTTVFTHELPNIIGAQLKISDWGLGFLVDSIVLLNYAEVESSMKKVISILKMRGSDHDKSIKEFVLQKGGVKVMEGVAGYEGLLGGSARKSIQLGKRLDKFFK